MSIRITQQYMYQNMIGNMQSGLGKYMEAIDQSSSQKAVNRPSDDPAATYRILTARNAINNTNQYLDSINTAKGWLKLTDDVLSSQVTTTIRSLIGLAEQASTGTYNANNRQQMSFEARELLGQLLNLSNTEFNGNSIFAGHKYDQNAYEMGLTVTLPKQMREDANIANAAGLGNFTVRGASQTSIAFQFLSDDGLPVTFDPANMPLDFRFSSDGGKTWHNGTMQDTDINNGIATLRLSGAGATTGVEVDFPVSVADLNALPAVMAMQIPTAKRDSDFNNELSFFVQNTAFYQGDASDPPPNVIHGTNVDAVVGKAAGNFSGNVMVKINGVPNAGGYTSVDLATANTEFEYSYSLDNGVSWVTAKMQTTGAQPLNLTVPGGYLAIDATNAGTPNEVPVDAEFTIHPDRAGLGYEIMQNTYVDVNNVGKDIFGGYWLNDFGRPVSASWMAHTTDTGTSVANDKLPESNNLFNIVSNFVTALEFNNQTGCQEALEKLNSALHHVTTSAAKTGGLENRVSLAYDVQIATRVSQDEVLSSIEDIDLTELLTRLTQYQTAYQTVLMSSSKIMNIGLMNYL